jgi:hypothetical protein
MKTRLLFALLLCAALAACASGPIYRPATKPGDLGYRDIQLAPGRYRVSFSGGYDVPREIVENDALFRAADVALAHHADHFRVTSRETLPITHNDFYAPSVGLGYGWGSPFWGAGFGYPIEGSSATRFEAVLEIQFGPNVPDQGPNIYNARQIQHNLSPPVAAGNKS